MKIKLIATIITILFSISSISCYAIESDEDIEVENNTFSFYSDLFEYDVITTNTNPPRTNVYVYLSSDIMAIDFFKNIEVIGGSMLLIELDATQFPISAWGDIPVYDEDEKNNYLGYINPIVVEDVNLDGNVGKMDLILTLKKVLIEPSFMGIYMRQYDFNNDGEINCFDLALLKREIIYS